MARVKVRLDHAGISAILKSGQLDPAVAPEAARIAAEAEAHQSVRRHQVPVKVDHYVTDRSAYSVTLAHPAGLNIDAKYGVLSKYAGGRGKK